MSSTKKLDLDRYVPGLVTFIANKLSAGASLLYRENFGIGVVEWRVLLMLAVENGIPAQRICQVIGLDKSVVSRSLALLQKDGLVHTEVDQRDARRLLVHLTEKGHTLHDEVFQVASAREKLLLSRFTAEEQNTLIRLLNVMHEQVDKVNAHPYISRGKRKSA